MNLAAAFSKALKAVRRAARCLGEMLKRIKKRIRLWGICRKLKIKPTKWQMSFIMGDDERIPFGRRNGKTTAVILRTILEEPEKAWDACNALARDPDWWRSYATARWEMMEYLRFCKRCGVMPVKKGRLNVEVFQAYIREMESADIVPECIRREIYSQLEKKNGGKINCREIINRLR